MHVLFILVALLTGCVSFKDEVVCTGDPPSTLDDESYRRIPHELAVEDTIKPAKPIVWRFVSNATGTGRLLIETADDSATAYEIDFYSLCGERVGGGTLPAHGRSAEATWPAQLDTVYVIRVGATTRTASALNVVLTVAVTPSVVGP